MCEYNYYNKMFEYSVKMAEYEDTTKLYDIINHYMDDEILTVEISHSPAQNPLVNNEHHPCAIKDIFPLVIS